MAFFLFVHYVLLMQHRTQYEDRGKKPYVILCVSEIEHQASVFVLVFAVDTLEEGKKLFFCTFSQLGRLLFRNLQIGFLQPLR